VLLQLLNGSLSLVKVGSAFAYSCLFSVIRFGISQCLGLTKLHYLLLKVNQQVAFYLM